MDRASEEAGQQAVFEGVFEDPFWVGCLSALLRKGICFKDYLWPGA